MSASGPASRNRIYFRLQRAAHVLKKQADEALLAGGGLTAAQAGALMIIGRNAPVSQRRVAGILQQNESAMTAMVRRLLALGYVERQRAPDDVRRWDLSITASGSQALAEAGPVFEALNAAIEDVLKPDEIALLARMLDAIIEIRSSG